MHYIIWDRYPIDMYMYCSCTWPLVKRHLPLIKSVFWRSFYDEKNPESLRSVPLAVLGDCLCKWWWQPCCLLFDLEKDQVHETNEAWMKEIQPISSLLAAVLVRCCFRRIETSCFCPQKWPFIGIFPAVLFVAWWIPIQKSWRRRLWRWIKSVALARESEALGRFETWLRNSWRVLWIRGDLWGFWGGRKDSVCTWNVYENPIICTFWSTQLFQQETISKSDQQSVKHRISKVKLTKTLKTNPWFSRVKQKNGAQFDQGWFFLSSWFLPQGAVTWNMPGAASVWKIWFKCVRWPVTFATGRFRRRIFLQNTKKTWKHQKSERPTCTEQSPKHAEHCMNCCIFRCTVRYCRVFMIFAWFQGSFLWNTFPSYKHLCFFLIHDFLWQFVVFLLVVRCLLVGFLLLLVCRLPAVGCFLFFFGIAKSLSKLVILTCFFVSNLFESLVFLRWEVSGTEIFNGCEEKLWTCFSALNPLVGLLVETLQLPRNHHFWWHLFWRRTCSPSNCWFQIFVGNIHPQPWGRFPIWSISRSKWCQYDPARPGFPRWFWNWAMKKGPPGGLGVDETWWNTSQLYGDYDGLW